MPKTATPRKPESLERRLAETRNTSRNRSLAALLGIEDRNPLKDMLSATNDVVGRGTIAGFLGLPGDLGGMAENGVRYALGMPQVTPYGGSEHIGQQMEKAGLVTAKRRPVAETLASLISPSAAATAVFKAPAAARAGVRLLDNLADSRGMGRGLANSQVGAIDVGPQAKALRVAQQNAAKPIEEGGLGLRPDNTPEERAAAMGFDTQAYHGTTADVKGFDLSYSGSDGVAYGSPAVFSSKDANLASDYAKWKFNRNISDAYKDMQAYKNQNPGVYDDGYEARYGAVKDALKSAGGQETGDGANVLPLLLRGDYMGADAAGQYYMQAMPSAIDGAVANGFDGVNFSNVIDHASEASKYPTNVMATFDPRNIRSRFAAFDPMRRDSSDILAGLAPLGLGAWMYQNNEQP